ncbi:hypothetical protein pb186bvf_013847 [Paramecium bursaria]
MQNKKISIKELMIKQILIKSIQNRVVQFYQQMQGQDALQDLLYSDTQFE